LKKRVAEGAFREDLYYRLNVITVEMPPLRARPRDVLRFAEHYVRHCAIQFARKVEGFTDEAADCIRRYSWPGNLRELRNTIERAVILAPDTMITASDLPAEIRQNLAGPGVANDAPLHAGAMVSLQSLEDQHIRRVLEVTSSMNEAAEILGIDQATLYRKRKKMGIS
jgi:NtrC-family two-component system response regulator AlgB